MPLNIGLIANKVKEKFDIMSARQQIYCPSIILGLILATIMFSLQLNLCYMLMVFLGALFVNTKIVRRIKCKACQKLVFENIGLIDFHWATKNYTQCPQCGCSLSVKAKSTSLDSIDSDLTKSFPP